MLVKVMTTEGIGYTESFDLPETISSFISQPKIKPPENLLVGKVVDVYFFLDKERSRVVKKQWLSWGCQNDQRKV